MFQVSFLSTLAYFDSFPPINHDFCNIPLSKQECSCWFSSSFELELSEAQRAWVRVSQSSSEGLNRACGSSPILFQNRITLCRHCNTPISLFLTAENRNPTASRKLNIPLNKSTSFWLVVLSGVKNGPPIARFLPKVHIPCIPLVYAISRCNLEESANKYVAYQISFNWSSGFRCFKKSLRAVHYRRAFY